jgi:uncharacterized coiled-coil protein SlyX
METKDNKFSNDLNQTTDNVVMKSKLQTARKEGVTKGALITGIIGVILLAALGILAYSINKRDYNNQVALLENQKQVFTQQLTERDSMINDWLTTFDEIENNLNAIKEKEKIISVKASDSEISKDKKSQVLEDIKYINSLLDENKKKIAGLNAQLKKSGTTITGLQARIAELETSMKQYETEVTELKASLADKNFEIEQLNTRVFALNDTLNMQEETISNQINELNKAFFATGTYKDLKEKGLVSKEGGFLGIGRKESLKEDFPDSLFEMIDVTQLKTIPLNSKKAKLITEHPSGSYQMVRENENTIACIEIKDPAEFWKISKYAVVEIVK